jgi:hypothetical protein
MGFAWMPDKGADAHGEPYRDDQGAARRYYRVVSARGAFRGPAGRHALSHGQRRLLASFGVASLVPLGRSRSALPGSRQAMSHLNRGQSDRAVSPEARDYSSGGRGAHAARLTDVPRRPSGWSGPERWRRWA